MKKSSIPLPLLQLILSQAEKEYPKECCGVILGTAGASVFSRVQPVQNVQDEYHAQDPQAFPRTGRQAYFMAPRDLLALQKSLRAANEEIRVIYHSHIDAPAHFSNEDNRMALMDGQPVYPGIDYLIVSVAAGPDIRETCLSRWDAGKHDFMLLDQKSF
jgi:proteasome lid subunit RPN8/RPN11